MSADGRILVGDIPARFHSAPLLLCGTLNCIFNFVVVTVIAIWYFIDEPRNRALNHAYGSGNGYFPASMGEMVHNQDSPGGKIFHTFGLMATVLIIMSWYPMHLRNVYTGRKQIFGIYWTTWRQLLPAMGLLLLNGVNTYPYQIAINSPGFTKIFCVVIHALGSSMLFFGYVSCECVCIGLSWRFWQPPAGLDNPERSPHLKSREWWWRAGLMWGVLVCAVLQVFFQVLLYWPYAGSEHFLCCADEWKLPGENVTTSPDPDDPNVTEVQHLMKPQIFNTASGAYLALKVCSFLVEDLTTLMIAVSQLIIWYYCDERHFEAKDWNLDVISEVEWYDVKD